MIENDVCFVTDRANIKPLVQKNNIKVMNVLLSIPHLLWKPCGQPPLMHE